MGLFSFKYFSKICSIYTIRMEKIPRISPKKSLFEDFFDFLEIFWEFLIEYQVLILILSIVIFGIIFFKKNFSKKEKHLKKIWNYTLFFLTKRQMMIPLVYSLAQKDGILDSDILKNLLALRNECRGKSLKKNPTERLKLEQHISQILFYYFSALEKEKKIKPNTKFKKIVNDLEFIDSKLVQLQNVYNIEVIKWNKKVNHKLIGWFFQIFSFKKFEVFEIPH